MLGCCAFAVAPPSRSELVGQVQAGGGAAGPSRSIAVLGAAATLSATLLSGGGAVTPLTLAVRETGYIMGPLLSAASAVWTLHTSWVLLRASDLAGTRSYESIALSTLGATSSVVVQIIIVLNALLTCVAAQDITVH